MSSRRQSTASGHTTAVNSPSTSPPSSPKLAAKRLNQTISRDDVDLGGDLDIEAQINDIDGVPRGAAGEEEKQEKQEQVDDGKPSPAPTTLGPDDPLNPRTWNTGKKALINTFLCTWVLTLTYSSTAYVSSLRSFIVEYNISQEVALLGVTLMVLGFAAGPLLFAPCSELYGRRIVYQACALFYIAFAWGCAFAPSGAGLLVFRFLMGFFGSTSLTVVPASIADFTTAEERQSYTTLYALMAFGGPSLGPLISNYIDVYASARWNLIVMACFITVISIGCALIPETHGPTILRWRIAREGNAPAKPSLRQVLSIFRTAVARPLVYLFCEPIVTLVSLYLSVVYAALYGFFEAFEVVWVEIRGFKETSYGLTYIALGLGFVAGCAVLNWYGQYSYMRHVRKAEAKGEKVRPEARLDMCFIGAVATPVSLFIFAWTAPYTHVHWIAPCIGEALFSFGVTMIFASTIPYLIDNYLATAASALAAGTFARAVLASVFPLFALQMYHKLTVQGATSLLGGITILLAPIPFLFVAKGDAMRARSAYAVQF